MKTFIEYVTKDVDLNGKKVKNTKTIDSWEGKF